MSSEIVSRGVKIASEVGSRAVGNGWRVRWKEDEIKREEKEGGGGGRGRIGGGAVRCREVEERERRSGGRRDEGIVRRADEGRVGSVTFRIARTRTLCGGCRAREKRILFPLLRVLPSASEELITSAISPSLDAAEDHDFRRDPS